MSHDSYCVLWLQFVSYEIIKPNLKMISARFLKNISSSNVFSRSRRTVFWILSKATKIGDVRSVINATKWRSEEQRKNFEVFVLSERNEIVITKADKGSFAVILDLRDYISETNWLLNNNILHFLVDIILVTSVL